MTFVYMVILCLSAMLASWAGVRVARRVGAMVHLPVTAGWCALLPALAFLMVVGAPAPVLVGALFVALMVVWKAQHRPGMLVVMTAAAVLMGLMGMRAPSAAYMSGLPEVAALAAAGGLWLVLSVPSGLVAGSAISAVVGLAGGFLPLLAIAILVPQAHPLMLDACIAMSALGGVLLAKPRGLPMGHAPQLGLGFVLAYLQVAAVWQGAWIAAVVSVVFTGVWLAWAWMQPPGKVAYGA